MDDLCDLFGNCTTASSVLDCESFSKDLPNIRAIQRRQPRRECKSTISINKELLKRAISKISNTDENRIKIEKIKKQTKWSELLLSLTDNIKQEDVDQLKKHMLPFIDYAKPIYLIFIYLDAANNEYILDNETYLQLYEEITKKRDILSVIEKVTSGEATQADYAKIKELSTTGDKTTSATFKSSLMIQHYDKEALWKNVRDIKTIISRRNEMDVYMTGGSEIMRMYNKYCSHD